MRLLSAFASRKAALAIGGAVLTAGLLSATALATLPTDTTAATTLDTTAQKGDRDHKGRIATVLQQLVDKGTITASQRDAILEALKAAAGDHDKKGHDRGERHFLGDVLQASSQYLGVPVADLKAQLKAGKSLGQIAGSKRDGLIDALTQAANARIKAAVDAGKLTPEQAEKARAKVSAAIVRIVDHQRGHTTK